MRYLTAVAFLLIASSASAAPDDTLMDRIAAVSVTCSGKLDCDTKWAKALQWVLGTPGFKIQLANDMLIQTYGPSYSIHATAFTITKMPTGPDSYKFDWQATCWAQPFCGLTPAMYRATFVTAVMGAEMAKSPAAAN